MKNAIEFLKELRKKPYGKGVFFFSFYLVFFIVIFIALSIKGNDIINENESDSNFNVTYLEKYNYSFEYKVKVDNNTYSYIGNKDNRVFNYSYNEKDYYNEDGKSYLKEDSKEVENPIKFNKLFDENMIDKVLNSSYIESTNSYDSGEVVYNLLVSSNTLSELLDNAVSDVEEVPNKIKVSMNNGFITEINYNLDSYCKINYSCSSLNITINYKEFNVIS